MIGTAARVWSSVRAPGPPPPGVLRFTTLVTGGTLLVIGLLVALGIRDHGTPAWHFYEARAGTYYSAALLVAGAVLAFRIAHRLAEGRLGRFWRGAGAGLLFLAYDEVFLFHEGVDQWLHARLGWPADHPVTTHIDDAIVALYGVATLWWGVRYRDALLRLPWATRLFALAFVGFVGTTALDVLNTSRTVEECVKVLAEALIVAGFYAAARDPGVYFSRL